MNFDKELNLSQATQIFTAKGIVWQSFNNGIHWKIGKINFFPTTHRWNNEETGESGKGLKSALAQIQKPLSQARQYLSVEQFFNIAKSVKPMNLMAVCEELHKKVYK